MNFDPTEEQRLIREMTRRFADEVIAPEAADNDRLGRFPLDLIRRMAALGLLGGPVPKEYGGPGLDFISHAILTEEVGRADSSLRTTLSVQVSLVSLSLLRWGNEEQKRRYLPELCAGRLLGCFGLTEPNAGSDLASLQMRAERDGDHYVVTGQKIWTTLAHISDWYFVLVRTSFEGPKWAGLTLLLMDLKSPGVEIRPIRQIDGGTEFNEVFMNEVRVPVEITTRRSWSAAERDGFAPVEPAAAAAWGDVIVILAPDLEQPRLYRDHIAPHLSPGRLLLFAHGFAIRFGWIDPPAGVDVAMVAPKAPGHRVREVFLENAGTPALVAVHADSTGQARTLALSYAKGLGCTRAGVIETSFAEETETDLFGEQAVLCGGVSALVTAGFETLVEAGYQPEVAYFECMHEMKLIVDLFYQGGLAYMRYSVSDTAEYGDYTRGPRVVNDETKAEMKKILSEIQSGQFAREWVLEKLGQP